MRKIILSVILAGLSIIAFAVPAKPGKYRYIQPDGSTIYLERHGDEYYNWTTDADGNYMEEDAMGFYRRTSRKPARVRSVAPRMSDMWSSYETAPVTNFGDRRILAILVEFADTTFSIEDPHAQFSAMLNQKGYSANGAYGSVKDYYEENSLGQYRPVFDVYGPVRVSGPQANYGYNVGTDQARVCFKEACGLLDSQINFADYDSDGDGTVDMILFYYAGHNPSEGASKDAIWPHKSSLSGTFDEVKLGSYFCTSELKNVYGKNMCGIGTTCHEFAHSLGLPDFYDTDYEKNGGENEDLGKYSIMSGGNYLDDGRRPCNFNAIERNMLGWMENFPTFEDDGKYILEPVSHNKAYTHGSQTEGEYFVYEYRSREGWDEFLPEEGLLVYHIDKSQNIVPGSNRTAAYLWESTNSINCYYGHPCARLLLSGAYCKAFPAKSGNNYVSPCDWQGNAAGYSLTNITSDGKSAEFDLEIKDKAGTVWGTVRDMYGTPVKDATVRVSLCIHPFMGAPSSLSSDLVTYTDSDGFFSIRVPDSFTDNAVLTVSAPGLVSQGLILDSDSFSYHDFIMTYMNEMRGEVYNFDPSMGNYKMRLGTRTSVAAAVKVSEDLIKRYNLSGSKIKFVSFASPCQSFEKIYAIVAYGDTPVLVKDISDKYDPDCMLTLSLIEDDISVPSSGDLYIGYAISGFPEGSYSIYAIGFYEEKTPASISSFTPGSDFGWRPLNSTKGYMIANVRAILSGPYTPTPEETGVSYLDIDKSALTAGSAYIPTVRVAAGKPVSSTTLFYDGKLINQPAILTEGSHTFKAVIIFCDGTKETVYYDFDIEGV